MASSAGAADRPNLVVLFADDMGYGQPSSYGGTLAATPHIDALAAAGARFTQGYAAACVCSPSRVGLLTGRHPARTGQDHLINRDPARFLSREETLLPQLLKEAGYATGIFGKWHLGHGEGYRPTDRGFDTYYGPYTNKNQVEHYNRGTDAVPKPPIDSPVLAAEAARFIAAHRDRPFFLYVPFTAVHAPHEASPGWLDRFSGITDPRARVYAAMCAELDEAVGIVVAALRENGLEDNTLVLFTSDNGREDLAVADNGPLRGSKWSLLEGGIREPLVIRWPGRIAPGRTVDTPVSLLDFFPTALAVAGMPVPASLELDGVSLLPLLLSETASLPRDTFFWRYGAQFALRQGDWKLVRSERDEPLTLYHLAADPGESNDLSTAEPGRAAALLACWEAWNAAMRPPRWDDPRADGLRHRREFLERWRRQRESK